MRFTRSDKRNTTPDIAEVGIELISAKQVLEKCDRIAELGPLEVTWVEVTDNDNILQTWVGSLPSERQQRG